MFHDSNKSHSSGTDLANRFVVGFSKECPSYQNGESSSLLLTITTKNLTRAFSVFNDVLQSMNISS